MATSTYPAQMALLLLSVAGIYTTWYLLYFNGTASFLHEIRDAAGNAMLPTKDAPLRQVFTGHRAIDYQLTVLTLFFWQLVDGSSPHASLHAFHFAGQIVAGWGLLMMEGMRAGNRWRVVSFIVLWGIAFQNATFAVIMPIWMALHLATSPTVSPTNANIAIAPAELVYLGTSVTLGFIVPSLFVALPAPTILSYEAKQAAIAFWQGFPLWTGGIQLLLSTVFGSVLSPKAPGESEHNHQKAVSNAAYSYLLTVAGVTHICTSALVLSSTYFPSVYSSHSQGMFDIAKVFAPFGYSPSAKASSLADGTFQLIQYDEIVGSAATLLWAVALYLQAYGRSDGLTNRVGLVFRVLIGMATTGPLGCAVLLMWSRDDLVHGRNSKTKKSI